MQRLTRLTVLSAGFRRALSALDADARLPALEGLAARGRRQQSVQEHRFQALEAWQLDLVDCLQLHPLASAPVSALGAGLDTRSGTWLHADFVHLETSLDRMILVPLRAAQALDDTDTAELSAALAPHVQDDGYQWFSAGSQAFLHTAARLEAETCAPGAASRLPLVEAMPRGAESQRVRRLMTELQMRLHEHPVNERRERHGLLAANAVWLWGVGVTPSIERRADLPHAYADDSYVRGIYRMHDRVCRPVPDTAAALLDEAAGEVLLLLHCDTLTELEARWLAPFERALNAGHIGTLRLILDDTHITAHRWSRWRVWRRRAAVSRAFA